MNKVYPSVDEAVADIPDGASIAIGGFFTAGTPIHLVQALARQGAKDLTIICMQVGPGNEDIIQLVRNQQVKRAICNYPFYRSVSRGADDPFDILASYEVFGWDDVAQVYESATSVWNKSTYNVSGVHPGLEPYKQYFYSVRAKDVSGQLSDWATYVDCYSFNYNDDEISGPTWEVYSAANKNWRYIQLMCVG